MAGLGYVALAPMTFERWRPWDAPLAGQLCGFAASLQTSFQVPNVRTSSAFFSMSHSLMTILPVSGLVGQLKQPTADAKPSSGS